jgi:hypothetical protein
MKDEIAKEINNAETVSKVEDIRSIMKNFQCTVEQAMDALEIPQQKRSIYISKL